MSAQSVSLKSAQNYLRMLWWIVMEPSAFKRQWEDHEPAELAIIRPALTSLRWSVMATLMCAPLMIIGIGLVFQHTPEFYFPFFGWVMIGGVIFRWLRLRFYTFADSDRVSASHRHLEMLDTIGVLAGLMLWVGLAQFGDNPALPTLVIPWYVLAAIIAVAYCWEPRSSPRSKLFGLNDFAALELLFTGLAITALLIAVDARTSWGVPNFIPDMLWVTGLVMVPLALAYGLSYGLHWLLDRCSESGVGWAIRAAILALYIGSNSGIIWAFLSARAW
jgi:hypothetical protein